MSVLPQKSTGFVTWLLVQLGRWFISLLFFLNRKVIRGEENLTQARSGNKAVFVGFWHGRMLYPIYYLRRYKPAVLVSPSRDGRFLTRLLKLWGFKIIPGSSSRGGREAIRRMAQTFEQPRAVVITAIDGPVGPARIAKSGSLALAVRKGALLIPLSGSASRCWTFRKSWDQFQLPKPFGRVVIQVGQPLSLTPDTDPDEITRLMSRYTNELERITDALAANLE